MPAYRGWSSPWLVLILGGPHPGCNGPHPMAGPHPGCMVLALAGPHPFWFYAWVVLTVGGPGDKAVKRVCCCRCLTVKDMK